MAAPILGRPGISEIPHARHVGLFDWSEEHRSVKLLIDQHGDDAALIEAAVARLERWPEWTQTERPTRLCRTSQACHGHIEIRLHVTNVADVILASRARLAERPCYNSSEHTLDLENNSDHNGSANDDETGT